MNWKLSLSAMALLAASLAALYARWSAREAKRSNDIGRLNALLALRTHYLALMRHQEHLAKVLSNSPAGLQAQACGCSHSPNITATAKPSATAARAMARAA